PKDDDDDEPRPSKRRRRDDDYEDDHEDDYEEAPRRRRRREKPGKVQAIGIMTLIGGILATLTAVILMITIYGLCWPGTYYSLVLGIMAIVKGSQLLGERAPEQLPPSGIAIMQIINIVNCDWINLTLGIINLVFPGDEEVKSFCRRSGADGTPGGSCRSSLFVQNATPTCASPTIYAVSWCAARGATTPSTPPRSLIPRLS